LPFLRRVLVSQPIIGNEQILPSLQTNGAWKIHQKWAEAISFLRQARLAQNEKSANGSESENR
jgi:hypothetical protein